MADSSSEYEEFVANHRSQLSASRIPEIFWQTLHEKLKDEIFDANDYFTLTYDEEGDLYPVVTHQDGIKKDNKNCIFLVDHAWTYEAEFARAQLENVSGLARRMAKLMNLVEVDTEVANGDCKEEIKELNGTDKEKSDHDTDETCTGSISLVGDFYTDQEDKDLPKPNVVELILKTMWRFNQTYQMQIMQPAQGETTRERSLLEQVSFWYIMDEFGSKIPHSDDPSWNVSSFLYAGRGISYSIMFPLKDQEHGDAVTRDFATGVSDPAARTAALYPWFPAAFQVDDEANKDTNIDDILFSNAERSRETYSQDAPGVVYLLKKDSYAVYTDVSWVAKGLREPFHLVDDPDTADIIWVGQHIKEFQRFQDPGVQFINQFPFENVLTCKDLLARVVARVPSLHPAEGTTEGATTPPWFQQSFNLNLELPQFVRNFLERKPRNEDNTWIIKPWNLGRSMDIHISQDLNHIVRLRETGPKIAFKYIDKPVLFETDFGKVKFHFRYMPAVTCMDPLIIDVDEVFWISCANKPFSMDDFHVYEKHFTTMNYRNVSAFQQVHYNEFREKFGQQYPSHTWAEIERKVHQIIRELFEAASSEPGPRGIPHCKPSRAYYALDFMLKWADDGSDAMQPVLLEVNYTPDCKRLVKYHPEAFHHLFTRLFIGTKTPWPSVRL